MARSHQRSIRIEDEHVEMLNSLPHGTVNTLINELLTYFSINKELQAAVILQDNRFKDWKMPIKADIEPDIEKSEPVIAAPTPRIPVKPKPVVPVDDMSIVEPIQSEQVEAVAERSKAEADDMPDDFLRPSPVGGKPVEKVDKPSPLDDLMPDY